MAEVPPRASAAQWVISARLLKVGLLSRICWASLEGRLPPLGQASQEGLLSMVFTRRTAKSHAALEALQVVRLAGCGGFAKVGAHRIDWR